MRGRCPHNVPGEPCPSECNFTLCTRETHVVCSPLDMLDAERDFDAAMKEVCRICDHFIKHGPARVDDPNRADRKGNPNRFIL